MNDKHTHTIRDTIDELDVCRAELAGVIELMDWDDIRLGHVKTGLNGLRDGVAFLLKALNEEDQS